MLHPFPKQLISFSAGNLRESLRGPQPFQLSFVSRRPARPAVPPSRGCAKGPQPLCLPSAGGGVYPAEERFFHPAAHKKQMKPHAPSVPETAYLLFSRKPPGEFERAAALSTFLRIPATCAPRRSPFPGMREGAAAPLPSFRRRGRVPRRGAIFPSGSAQKTDEAPCSIRSRNLCRRKIASASSKSVCGNAVRGF